MNVKDLIEFLQEIDDDTEVILAKDEEGNGFSPLANEYGLSTGIYVSESTYSGEFYTSGDFENAVKAVCLWPVN